MDGIWPNTSHMEREAFYQAGCAIVALRESLEVIRVSIEDRGNAVASWIDVIHPDLSRAQISGSVTAHGDAKAVIRALLAGPATSLRYSFGTYPQDCRPPEFNLADPWMVEQEAVWRAISLAGKISKVSPSLLRSLWRETNGLIQGGAVWPAIDAVANMLLITGELAGCEIRDIARHAKNSNAAGL
jgi:hypothetical protein